VMVHHSGASMSENTLIGNRSYQSKGNRVVHFRLRKKGTWDKEVQLGYSQFRGRRNETLLLGEKKLRVTGRGGGDGGKAKLPRGRNLY